MGTKNPKVDAYIAKAKPFAQPILEHLRELMHKGCPDVEESIKWSMPFFEYKGAILGNMAGFKEHCSFGFWDKGMGAEMRNGGSGPLRHIASLGDLPADKQLLAWIRQTAQHVDRGEYQNPMATRSRKAKPEAEVPAEFALALKKNRKAAAVFADFSPSCRREYVEWVAEARREETRAKRIATAVEWIAEGKQRNWKYQECRT
ncbi:MAG TPA: YdeI/OmpD-associated family protein [Acidobacteriaceae bacterium]|nr:YdeI/OmpD-associated family protein [Acidobacteriaceae bacterium]